MNRRTLQTVVLPLSLLLAACGGGSSGGSSSGVTLGLAPPAELNLVQPVGAATNGGNPSIGSIELPADSDYATDRARTNVYDPAIEPLESLNSILCFLDLTGSNLLVNEAPFLAQIDPTLCEEGQDAGSVGSENGQSTGTTSFELWTAQSTRANNTAPQLSSIWVPRAEDGDDSEIRVSVEIAEGATDENPFGSWSMSFAGAGLTDLTIVDPPFYGTIATVDTSPGQIGFEFFEESGDIDLDPAPGDYAYRSQVSVRVNEDQTSGFARLQVASRYNDGGGSVLENSEFLVAFDETHFLRSTDGGAEVLYSREDFAETVWQYNLYHATGANAGERVDLNSGFGFRTADGDYGYAGYYGVWLPNDAVLESGDTVFRDVYDEPSELVPYTLTKGGGKLVKFTRNEVDLDDVQGDSFQWGEFDDGQQMHQQYLISWDGANWVRTHSIDQMSYEATEIDPPTVIDTAGIGFLSMFSDSLGGSASWTIDEPLLVTYYSQTFEGAGSDLFTGADEVTFFGLVSCLRSGITGAESEAGNVYLADATDVMSPYQYVFSQSDLTLYQDVDEDGMNLTRAGLADGEIPEGGPYHWGMQSGPLVLDLTGLDDVWDVWSLPEFWQYETGHNEWNVLWSVADASDNEVSFDAPIQFSYTHATANDRNENATYDGKTYFLSYDGPGQLHGLPSAGSDLDGDMQEDRYFPVVSLVDGVLVGPQGTEYVVRAIDIEQTLTTDPGGNAVLELTGASDLVVPDGSTYEVPTIGVKPVVTDAPRVINGTLVGAGASASSSGQ